MNWLRNLFNGEVVMLLMLNLSWTVGRRRRLCLGSYVDTCFVHMKYYKTHPVGSTIFLTVFYSDLPLKFMLFLLRSDINCCCMRAHIKWKADKGNYVLHFLLFQMKVCYCNISITQRAF